jgi:hypothetical protein
MLEIILHDYFGLQEDWNDIYEKEKENWYNAYNKLISLIYDLGELGVLENANIIVDKLDIINNIEE